MELKNGIHKQTLMVASEEDLLKRGKYKALSIDTERWIKSPPKVGLTAVFISFLKSHYF